MITLEYSEFYITNVCNLACPDCNRFNNYTFKGHQRWVDYQEEYEKWSKIVSFPNLSILGGEPLLAPDFMDWVHGIAKFWPNTDIRIITNGTQFHRWPSLIDELARYHGRIYIEVNEHNKELFQHTQHKVKKILGSTAKEASEFYDVNQWNICYNYVKDPSWPTHVLPWDFKLLDDKIQQECINTHQLDPALFVKKKSKIDSVVFLNNQNIRIECVPAWHFTDSALVHDSTNGSVSLRNSDANTAAGVCEFLKSNCHHFVQGKLYKCGVVALLPEFTKQFSVSISKVQQDLIDSYVPAVADWPTDQLELFLQNLINKEVIDQCRLCPERYNFKEFTTSTKKNKIHKIIPVK